MQASAILFYGNSNLSVFGDAVRLSNDDFALYTSPHSITQVSCCPHSSYFRTSEGQIYGAGLNEVGELCVNPDHSSEIKEFVKIAEHVKFIACGHSFVLTLSSMLFDALIL